MDTVLASIFGALGLAALAVAAVLGHRLSGALDRNRRLATEAETSRELLAAAPDGLYFWDHNGGDEHCSRRLAVLLDLPAGTDSRFGDVLARFEGDAVMTLGRATAALCRDGTSFDLILPTAGGPRTVHAVGVRAGSVDGRNLADLVWMRDLGGDAETTRRAAPEATGRAGESERIKALLDALPVPVWLRDADLELSFSNRASEGSALAEPSRALADRALGESRSLAERHLVSLGGKPRLFEVTETPVEGWPGTIGLALDRSATEEMEGEISRTATAQAQVLENLATAIGVFGPDTRIKSFNPAFTDLWQLDADWLASQPGMGEILDRLREQRRLPEYADFRAFKAEQMAQFEGIEEPVEALMHLPNGATLRSVVSRHPMGGLVFAYEDMTERLDLERSYNTLIAVQRETLDHLYEGVAVFGGDGRLRLSNPVFAKFWNLEDGEACEELHVADFVDRMRPFAVGVDDWPAHKERVMARLMGREPASGRLLRADGTVLDYADVPLPDGAMLLSYIEVTDSVRVELALRERAEALHQADRLKSEFIANVSHEIRTPMNTIVGFAEILSLEYFGKLNKRQKEYSHGILETSQELMTVVNDILDLASIEAGTMTLELDTVDLHSMLAGVFGLIRERARGKGLELAFDCPPEIGWIVADERRLKQVVFNLLSNAVAFTPPRGRIELAAERRGDRMVIAVSDTGTGIPPADQERVFRTFERAATPGSLQDGAGLGLSLVKRFVEMHGGRVKLESSPEKGTRVTCDFPAGGAESAAVERDSGAAGGSG